MEEDQGGIQGALSRQIGPFPAWAWGVIIGGGFILYKVLRGGSSAASTGPSADNAATVDPAALASLLNAQNNQQTSAAPPSATPTTNPFTPLHPIPAPITPTTPPLPVNTVRPPINIDSIIGSRTYAYPQHIDDSGLLPHTVSLSSPNTTSRSNPTGTTLLPLSTIQYLH